MSAPNSTIASLELLLDTLVVPDDLQAWSQLLREQLRRQPNPTQLAVTLQDMAELAVESRTRREQARAGVDAFLARTQQVLDEIEQALQTTDQQASAGYQATRKIDLTLERQLDQLEGKLRFSNTVEQVRDAVNQRLAVFRAGLDDGRGKRSLQFAAMQAQIMKVTSVLRNLHTELESFVAQRDTDGTHQLTDEASGLPNRVAFEQRLQQEYARWSRYGSPAALLLIEVAPISGTTAEKVDDTIRATTMNLRPIIRNVDFMARFATDTFGILMPETTLAATEALIARVRVSLSPLCVDGTVIRLGGSVLQTGDTAQALIARATTAAKADGPRAVQEAITVRG